MYKDSVQLSNNGTYLLNHFSGLHQTDMDTRTDMHACMYYMYVEPIFK